MNQPRLECELPPGVDFRTLSVRESTGPEYSETGEITLRLPGEHFDRRVYAVKLGVDFLRELLADYENEMEP